jgi:hypothetical protein
MPNQEQKIDATQRGKGNWEEFDIPLETIFQAAEQWRAALAGVSRPWLCWNVSDRWCMLQQRLIQVVGWTPVLGFDPRSGPPTALPGSILINFNEHFGLPVMWPHFPMEFAFLFTDRLAFWHADLLCSLDVMQRLKSTFESLVDGAMAAVPDYGGRRNWLNFRHHRYWELVGCTTKAASKSQFDRGSGWWRNIDCHPQCPDEKERRQRARYYYDSGVGIMYWKRHYGGTVTDIPNALVDIGHCTSINKKNYRQMNPGGPRNLGAEIDLNFDIEEVAAKLGIAYLL